jgi:hypothetical protein
MIWHSLLAIHLRMLAKSVSDPTERFGDRRRRRHLDESTEGCRSCPACDRLVYVAQLDPERGSPCPRCRRTVRVLLPLGWNQAI